LGRGTRFGIIESCFAALPEENGFTVRQAEPFCDGAPLLPEENVELLDWTGKTFLCGAGEVLKMAVPPAILSSPAALEDFAPLDGPAPENPGRYEELFLYECDTVTRWKKLQESLDNGYPFLALFPEQRLATAFFDFLSPALRESSLLWPATGGKKLQNAWITARKGGARGIIGGPGAVFAPLEHIRSVIVDEESSGAYRTYRRPFLNIRSVAARKALLAKAALTMSGRLPSSRVYLRGKPKCTRRPSRESVKFVDLKNSLSSEFQGISGSLPLSAALFSETSRVLSAGKTALWLLDRKGYAGEVACEECGNPILCSVCGRVAAWEEKRQRLRCSSCGRIFPLPETCPSCRGVLLTGKRPGLEALLPVARATASDEKPVFIWDGTKISGKKADHNLRKELSEGGIVLGTRSALALCDTTDVGFSAWIDADSEVRNVSFQAKFTAYSMIWESLWRGNPEGRTVLLQSRRPGSGWQKGILLGWDHFWNDELRERKELELPPFSFLLEIKCPSQRLKESIMAQLKETGLCPMDPGEPPLVFWVTVSSPARVWNALAPFYSIGNSRTGFPEITVWID
jgi:primosomal protein N' (replication factor Y)